MKINERMKKDNKKLKEVKCDPTYSEDERHANKG